MSTAIYEELLNSGPFAIIELFELTTFSRLARL